MRVSWILATGLVLGLATALPEGLQPRGNPCKSECQKNACMKAVIAENAYPFAVSAARDCSSYLATTVTPYAAITTVTVHPTVTLPGLHPTVTVFNTATVTHTDIATETDTTTVYTPSTSVVETDTTTSTTTTSLVNVNNKRTLIPLPSPFTIPKVPKYASKCANADAYKSACHCIYAQTHTVTAAQAAKTVTVTKGAVTITAGGAGVDTATATNTATVEQTITGATTVSTDYEPSLVPSTTTATTTTTVTVTPTPTFYLNSPQAPTGYLEVEGSGNGFFYIDQQQSSSNANLFYLNKQAVPLSIANAGDGFTYLQSTAYEYSLVAVTDVVQAAANGGTTLPCTIGPGPYTVGQTGSFTCSGPGGYTQFVICGNELAIAKNTSPAGCDNPQAISSLQFTITALNYGP